MSSDRRTFKLAVTALMAAMIFIATLIKIPTVSGYIHPGDAMIFLSVIVLGKRYGAFAGAVGSCLGDIIGGFPHWAVVSFICKFIMAYVMGLILERGMGRIKGKSLWAAACLISGLIEIVIYTIMAAIFYGSGGAIVEFLTDLGQIAAGTAIAVVLGEMLRRSPAGKLMEHGNLVR